MFISLDLVSVASNGIKKTAGTNPRLNLGGDNPDRSGQGQPHDDRDEVPPVFGDASPTQRKQCEYPEHRQHKKFADTGLLNPPLRNDHRDPFARQYDTTF